MEVYTEDTKTALLDIQIMLHTTSEDVVESILSVIDAFKGCRKSLYFTVLITFCIDLSSVL